MPAARIRPARPQRAPSPPLARFAALDDTHRHILQTLDELDRLAGLVAAPGHEAEAARLALRACSFFNTTARRHHEIEETFVFPAVLQGAGAALLGHVRQLQQDHDWIEEDWLELEPHLQAVAQGYRTEHHAFLREALPEFTALYHQHIALEEAEVYPEARLRKLTRPAA